MYSFTFFMLSVCQLLVLYTQICCFTEEDWLCLGCASVETVGKAPVYQIWGTSSVLCRAAKRFSPFYFSLTARRVLGCRIIYASGLLPWHTYLSTAVCH